MRFLRKAIMLAGVIGLAYWINQRHKGSAEKVGERVDRGMERADEVLHGGS
jgi:hypothetical protein